MALSLVIFECVGFDSFRCKEDPKPQRGRKKETFAMDLICCRGTFELKVKLAPD